CSQAEDGIRGFHVTGVQTCALPILDLARKLTVAGEIYPVLCGSAFKNRGVQPMLDAVVDYLPSPLDVPAIEAHDPKDEEVVIERSEERRGGQGWVRRWGAAGRRRQD